MTRLRLVKDRLAGRLMFVLTIFPGFLVLLIALGLSAKARVFTDPESLARHVFAVDWHPLKGEFGLWPFILGTIWVTGVALLIALPISLFTSIYLSEFASRKTRNFARPVIDLLAGLPSVVYGVWGVLAVVPLVGGIVAPLFKTYSSGYSILAGGVVLAVMIFPTIIHVSMEVFATVPKAMRDAALSLGATRWETIRHVVLRKGSAGIFAAGMLGLSRAFGETMAVLMVVGNVPIVPKSVLGPGYPLPALIANNYGEMMSIPEYDSALMLAALVLFLVVFAFSVLARMILGRVERRTR